MDLLDYLSYAQVDRAGKARGGWRYKANARDADMSVTQWPVLAYMSAQRVWGLEAPEWVKCELRDHFLLHIQGEDGGFGYRPGRRRANVGLTGAGLIALAFVDVDSDDDRVRRAAAYIDKNYKKSHLGELYNMYAIMKGARLSASPIATFGEHDWLSDYVQHLYKTQRKNGTWKSASRAVGMRATAWPALIISKDVFATSRPSTISWGTLLSVAGGLAAALAGFVLIRRARRTDSAAKPPQA